MTASAPGKLFLIGEYAVLHGGTAVITAVDRRAVARFVPGGQPSTPLIEEAVRVVRQNVEGSGGTLPEGAPEVDSATLNQDGQKLGLGSSAAAVVAAIGALWGAAGRTFDHPGVLWPLAAAAHRAAQGGRGSGGDVAAALFGNVIAYVRGEPQPALQVLSPAMPAELVVFRAGAPASTVQFLQAVERLEQRAPATHASLIQTLADLAAAFVEAHRAGATAALIQAVEAAHQALDALGRAADVPIVTPALHAAAALARQCGGAAKGSGAGGGDVGIGFFPDPAAAQAFRDGAPELGLGILSIKTGVRGLSRDG